MKQSCSLQSYACKREGSMSTSSLSIGELEAKHPLYCKALKMLIKQGKTSAELERTLCWDRLQLLHALCQGNTNLLSG